MNAFIHNHEGTAMATNPPTGDGHRNGAVRKRSQVKSPLSDKEKRVIRT
jgi:hypothetical protein